MQNTLVLVASEYAPMRRVIANIVEEESCGALVLEASNHIEATTLAKRLRPDIVLLDFNLPYTAGIDSVRLSRMSGLDTAQKIINEIPNVRVILLVNLEAAANRERNFASGITRRLSINQPGVKTSMTLRMTMRELYYRKIATTGNPIFANFEMKERVPVIKGEKQQKYHLA